MNILAFFDPSHEQADAAIEVAVALADHCILTGRALSLVCDGVTALEVGVAVMGLVDSPTVEGGERRQSRIRVLRLFGSREKATTPLDAEAGSDLDPLEQLKATGIFTDLASVPKRAEKMHKMIYEAACQARIVFGLGANRVLWRSADEGVREGRGHLIGVQGFVPTDLHLGDGLELLPLLAHALTGEDGVIGKAALRASAEARLAGQAVGTRRPSACQFPFRQHSLIVDVTQFSMAVPGNDAHRVCSSGNVEQVRTAERIASSDAPA